MSWAASRTISPLVLAVALSVGCVTAFSSEHTIPEAMELFNLQSNQGPTGAEAALSRWRLFSDRVMGGISLGRAGLAERDGQACLRLWGDVRLDNNGGFIQVASDLTAEEREAFATGSGLELEVYGSDETYNVHLRTEKTRYPWQSYRASFIAAPAWQIIRLPFTAFEPYRVDGPLAPATVRRIGIVAIGREFTADLCIARVAVYRD